MRARTTKSAYKFMFIIFMHMDGVLLQHAAPRDRRVSAQYYQTVLSESFLRGGGAVTNVVRTCSPTPLYKKAIKYV